MRTTLSGLVKTKRHNMRINHRHIEWRDKEVSVSKEDGHGPVNDTIIAVDKALWLEGVAGVVASDGQWCICEIQLLTPCNECGSTSRGRGDVGVVGANGLTGSIPFEENLLAGEAERLRLVVGNAWSTAISSNVEVLTASAGDIGDRWVSNARANRRVAVDVGVVQDVEGREVLPRSNNDRVSMRSPERCWKWKSLTTWFGSQGSS